DYSTTLKHDAIPYTIRVPDMAIPTCRKCGARVFTIETGDRIAAALRARVGILTPEEIRQYRATFNLRQQELADQLGVPIDQIEPWEEGGLIQSRAEDNLLRRFFEFREARRMLEQRATKVPA